MILKVAILLLPWKLRRLALNKFFHYDISPEARIGFSWIFPRKLVMRKGSLIGSFTIAVHLDQINMEEYSIINRNNWITGFPSETNSRHFTHQPERKSLLSIGSHSAITKNHHIDCTSPVVIGRYVTIAGYNSQFLTHSINLEDARQDSSPITIGDYSFIGTNCVVLGGSSLPSYSVLGAKSLLNKKLVEEYTLYGGTPAVKIKSLSKSWAYFNRTEGFIN